MKEKKLICKCENSFCYITESKIKNCPKYTLKTITKDISKLSKAI